MLATEKKIDMHIELIASYWPKCRQSQKLDSFKMGRV